MRVCPALNHCTFKCHRLSMSSGARVLREAQPEAPLAGAYWQKCVRSADVTCSESLCATLYTLRRTHSRVTIWSYTRDFAIGNSCNALSCIDISCGTQGFLIGFKNPSIQPSVGGKAMRVSNTIGVGHSYRSAQIAGLTPRYPDDFDAFV